MTFEQTSQPETSENPVNAWFEETRIKVEGRIFDLEIQFAEQQDRSDPARFKTVIDLMVERERYDHLAVELSELASHGSQALAEHHSELMQRLKGQNDLVGGLGEDLSTKVQAQAGLMATKLRVKAADTQELITILDK